MPQYTVECRGDAREVYVVEADSEAEALANWHTGDLVLSEASSMGPVSARLEED